MKKLRWISVFLLYIFLTGTVISFAVAVSHATFDSKGNPSYPEGALITNLVFVVLLLLALVFALILLAKSGRRPALSQQKGLPSSYAPEKRIDKYRPKELDKNIFFALVYAQKKTLLLYLGFGVIYHLAMMLVLYFLTGASVLFFVVLAFFIGFFLVALYEFCFAPLLLRKRTLKAPLPEVEIYPDKIIALDGERLFEVSYPEFDSIVETKEAYLFLYTDQEKKAFFFVKRELKKETLAFLAEKKKEFDASKKTKKAS